MTPCTMWYRHQGHGWEFNHMAPGHESGERPSQRHPNHERAWGSGEWDRDHAWLTDAIPPRVVYYSPEDLR